MGISACTRPSFGWALLLRVFYSVLSQVKVKELSFWSMLMP